MTCFKGRWRSGNANVVDYIQAVEKALHIIIRDGV